MQYLMTKVSCHLFEHFRRSNSTRLSVTLNKKNSRHLQGRYTDFLFPVIDEEKLTRK